MTLGDFILYPDGFENLDPKDPKFLVSTDYWPLKQDLRNVTCCWQNSCNV